MDLEYKKFLNEIKSKIRNSQYEALKKVNKELISLYWEIGKTIVENQEQAGWGKSVVENLAKDLQNEFVGMSGFSIQNLWYMRQFYSTYKDITKLQPLVGEIGWTHNILIMSKCKDNLEREFYLKSSKKFGWTKNVLINQIENKTYEKYLLNQTNYNETLPENIKNQAKLAVKDQYTYDFLELANQHSEHELENAIVGNIRNFLTEMGGYFTFIGNQYRIEIEDKEYFIDLLLFHRKLKCLIAIELKISEFEPEFAGKMQFYLAILNDKVKLEDENPSIGIIICKTKSKTIVEYALKNSNQPIGISTYTITKELNEDLKKYLPSPQEIEKSLQYL